MSSRAAQTARDPVPTKQFCRGFLAVFAARNDTETMPELIEGVDFYWEGPYMVFTEKYLKARGYCCESGCRHCPYGFKRDQRSDLPTGAEEDDKSTD
jgi:uncharacterized protein DUF5522